MTLPYRLRMPAAPNADLLAGTSTVPKADVHDPLEAHKDMLHSYTDKDIHDV